MKKRLISIFLMAAMLLSMMTPALAAESELSTENPPEESSLMDDTTLTDTVTSAETEENNVMDNTISNSDEVQGEADTETPFPPVDDKANNSSHDVEPIENVDDENTASLLSDELIYENLHYIVDNDAITITDCDVGATNISIPVQINGMNVTNIGERAFYSCRELTNIEIPNSITNVGCRAFEGCSRLASVTIPNSVTSIGDYAFRNCSCLMSVEIPNSVTSIGNDAFNGCNRLTSINVVSENEYYASEDGVVFNKNKTQLICFPKGKGGRYVIPDSVASIGNSAFEDCNGLTSVIIPNSVASIESEAFRGCSSLTSVKIPNSVTSIENYVFYCCISLTSVEIPNSVTSIGGNAFEYCRGLTSVTIPNSVTGIGANAFYGCISLTSVTIPNSVTSIERSAFSGCSSLTSVEIPNSITSIGGWAFYGCRSLMSVEIPNSVTSIESSAFSGCSSLISMRIPNSVTSIGNSAFRDCSSLTRVGIPSGVTSIGSWAFYGCSGLENIYYEGDKEQWNAVSIGSNNDALIKATIHYSSSLIEIGDYITLGKYYDEPILWRCVAIDENGPLMLSDKILCIKAYDAKGNSDYHYVPGSFSTIRKQYGSNCYADSNIRQWLNSTDAHITWTHDEPSNQNVSGGNPYNAESGFLSSANFNDNERNCMKSVTRKVYTNMAENVRGVTDGGSREHNEIDGLMSVQNRDYTNCFYMFVTDTVFIPDLDQLVSAYYNLGNEYIKAYPTECAVINSNYSSEQLNSKTPYRYWIAHAGTNGYSYEWVSAIAEDGTCTGFCAWDGTIGIRPAFYLNESAWNNGGSTYPGGNPQKIPVRSNDTDEVMSAALSQNDLTSLLGNVTLDMGELRGPSIKIAGKTLNLFEIDANLELPFKKLNVQASVDSQKKTIKVLLGYKPVKGGTTIVGDPNSTEDSRNDFWKSYTDAKDLVKTINGKTPNSADFRSKFQDVYDDIQKLEADLIVNVSGKVCLYAEFSYETGELKFSEGGGLLAVSLKNTINGRIPQFPVAYVTLRLEVSAEGEIKVVADENGWRFNPTLDAALKAAIAIGLGDNTGKIQAYIEGGLEGEIGAHVRPLWELTGEDLLSVDLSGILYLEWKIKAGLEIGDTYKKQLVKLGLYPHLELLSDLDTGLLTMKDFFSSSKPVTRDYLYAPSLMIITDDYSFCQTEYPYAEPTLLHLQDGRMLLTWVGDSGQKSDADRTSIFYSVYSSGAWSAPAVICESETYQDHPVLYQDGDTVYVVWMQADTQLENMEAHEVFHHLDLMFSSFDGGSWSTPVKLSSANVLTETDYVLSAKDGTIAVTWIENSENDMLMASGTNTIFLRIYENGTWGETSMIYSEEAPISGTDVDLSKGLQMSWSVSSGETTTTYVRDSDGNLRTSNGNDQNARWINGSYYELCNTELYQDGAPTGLSGLTNYEIVSSNTQTVALTLISTGFTCELYGSYYDTGTETWGPWTQLTGFDKYIRSYSAVLDESGKLVAALNLVNVDKNADKIYNNTNAELIVVDDCRYTALAVENWISYDDDLVTPGGTLPLSFRVTNNSLENLTEITVNVNEQSQTLICSLPAGESAVVTADYVLPDKLSAHEVNLTVVPNYTTSESNTENNSASVQIGSADLTAEFANPEMHSRGASVEVKIINRGHTDAENVVLKVYRSNLEGEVLCTQDLGQIAAGQATTYVFQIPADLLRLSDPETLNALTCEIMSDTEERKFANNVDRIVFDNLLPLPLQVSTSVETDVVKFDVSIGNEESDTSDGTVMLALYDARGKMLTVQSKSLLIATRKRTETEFIIANGQYPDAVEVKVFWIDAQSHIPITQAWQGSYPAA